MNEHAVVVYAIKLAVCIAIGLGGGALSRLLGDPWPSARRPSFWTTWMTAVIVTSIAALH